MLLRSSSTPVLGSLLSSFSDSPNNNNIHHHHDTNTLHKHHSMNHQSLNKRPLYQSGCRNLSTASCNSSPISPSIAEFVEHSHKGFRRAQSDGNLEGLAYASCNNNDNNSKDDQHQNSTRPKKFSGRPPKCLVLETIPSFSFCSLRGRKEDDDDEEEESDFEDNEGREQSEKSLTVESGNFSLSIQADNMVISEEVRVPDRIWNTGFVEEGRMIVEEMYLARGLGIDGGGNGYGGAGGCGGSGGGGSEFNFADGDAGDGGELHVTEEYYRKMVQENPGNPLFLRNYAEFLYQKKRDLKAAEEYFSRAILVDPRDGDILSQYAKLVWELHHDQDRASSYFERAVHASPEDSHIHAAYASFLWETEEDEDERSMPKDFDTMRPHFQEGAMATAG